MVREHLHKLWLRLKAVVKRRQLDRDLGEELEFHLAMREQKLIAEGMPPRKAHYAARRGFGNVVSLKETSREMWGFPALETLLQDVRYGLRQLRRSPGFTAVAILSLTLGIGANTAIFTVTDAVLLKSLPVKEPERLAMLSDPDKRGLGSDYCYRVYTGLRERNAVFSGLLARETPYELFVRIEGGRAEGVQGEPVSGNYFDVLGVGPYLGRTFSLEDERPPGNQVVVLSYGYWRARFGGDPGVIGRTIGIQTHPFTIIGVTPPGFFGIGVAQAPAIRIPLTTEAIFWPPKKDWIGPDNLLDDPALTKDHTEWLQLVGRLKPGVSFQQAEAALQPPNRQVRLEEAASPIWRSTPNNRATRAEFIGRKVAVSSGARGFSMLRPEFSAPLLVLMALATVVLLIACSTLANLLLARGVARQRELAIRRALGAGRMRLARHMLIESLVLSFGGGALAMLVAWWGASALIATLTFKSLVLPIGPDARVFGFTLGLSLAAALLFSLAPVYQAMQTQVMDALKQQGGALTGHGSQMALRRGLIALQMALSVLLLAGAGLFVRTLSSLRGVDTGLDTTRVLQMVDVEFHPYSPQSGPQAYLDPQRLMDRVESLPGVQSAAASWTPLRLGGAGNEFITVPGHQAFRVSMNRVTSRFFETLGIPLLAGRVWSRQDDYRQVQEAVVSQSLARDLFGGASPIGRSLSTFTSGDYTIVGIVRDINHYNNPREDNSRTVYLSPRGYWRTGLTICVRVAGDPARLVTAVRREAESTDPEVAIYDILTLESWLDYSLWNERLVAWLSSIFGGLAALLAAIGLYGVIAFTVARRTPEIGLRMALGAGRRQIQWLVLRDVMVLIGAGAAVGIPAALALTRLAKSLLFGVAPNDPATLAGAALLMGAVALLAGYLPARRATKVDPMVALRCE